MKQIVRDPEKGARTTTAFEAAAITGRGIWIGRGFQFASLIRFQIFLFLSPLLIVALSFLVKGIFQNLVNLDSGFEAFLVSWIGFDSSWFCLALVITVVDHAKERFKVDVQAPDWFWSWAALIFALPPAVLMLRVYASSPNGILGGLILGGIAAYLSAIVIDSVVHFLDPPGLTKPRRRFIFASTAYPKVLQDFFETSDPLTAIPPWLFRWLRHLGPGYLGKNERPFPDQIAVFASVFVAAGVYTISFLVGLHLLAHGRGTTYVPVLAYLEFLLLSVIIVIAGAAFYLDRFRIPVLPAVVIYSIGISMSFSSYTDHYWFASIPPNRTAVSPYFSDGVKEWLANYKSKPVLTYKNKPVVVVVCASGGGIEAAAWTARVLSGLYKEMGPAFVRSIRLITSTSGGSVGSLFFTQSYFTAKDVPSEDQFDNIWNASTRRSLDATGWGLAHPDFARLLFPFALGLLGSAEQAYKVDRGWALEQSWRVALTDPNNTASKYIDSNLSDWRDSVAKGLLPGTVFNATVVESGDPLLLSTVKLDLPTDSRSTVFGQSSDKGADISTVTAARLSATFPYVSPVAKGRYINDRRLPAQGMHIADGGYYDNFGVTVAVEWIKQITAEYGSQLGKIIVITIDAFPETSEKESLQERKENESFFNPRSGWGSEVLGPVKTILNSRSETQYGRDVIEFDLLKNDGGKHVQMTSSSPIASDQPTECEGFVNIVPFVALHSGPLSWQLSDSDKCKIQKDWSSGQIQKQIALLKTCLAIAR
jgi:hypothetical protein